MAILPTDNELRALKNKKGHNAIVLYALRNALRALSSLGWRAAGKTWTRQPVAHVYNIIRVSVLLYIEVFDNYNYHTQLLTFAKVAAKVAAKTANSPYAALAARTAVSAASGAPNASATAASNATAYGSVTSAAARAASRSDYLFLLNDNNKPNDIWLKPLWISGKPVRVAELEQALLTDLNNMGLESLAQDVFSLWNGKELGDHIVNYLQDISETELQSADDLIRFIFGTESVTENFAVRAILIGPGGAGKTSLSQLLEKAKTEDKTQPTIGVNYQNHKPLDFAIHSERITEGEHKQKVEDLRLYLWDFGGQAIFHSLHSAFMHENCVYIVVVDSRHEQAPDEWLHQIKEVTKNRGKVLVVTNWFDGINCQQNRLGLIRQFPQLLSDNSFYDFSCKSVEDKGFADFLNQLLLDCVHSQRQIFKTTQQAMDLVKDTYEQENFITIADLEDLLEENIDALTEREIKVLVGKLGEFGRYVNLDCHGDQLCIKPEWVVDKTYQLLYHETVQKQQGIITFKNVRDVLHQSKADKKDNLARKVLDFMMKQQVCIELKGSAVSDEKRYFLPDAAMVNEPLQLAQLMANNDVIAMAYELPYMPIGLRAALASELFGNKAVSIDVESGVWRDGLIVESVESEDCIVLEYQSRRQRIQLTLIGDPEGELATLLQHIDKALAEKATRQLIGHLILEDACKAMVVGGQTANPAESETLIETLKNSGINLTIQQVTKVADDSTKVVNSTITHSAVGNGATNQSNNHGSFNTSNVTMTAQQKTDISEVINQALQKSVVEDASGEQIALLADAKKLMASADGHLPQSTNEQTNGLMQSIWQTMKEVDSFASMAERSTKYIAPIVSSAMTYLAGV